MTAHRSESAGSHPLHTFLDMYDTRVDDETIRLFDDDPQNLQRLDALRNLVDERPPDRRVGPYQILDTLGEGAQGTVHLAFDERVDRYVALKVVRRLASDEARQRFRREAEIAARLDHVGLCPVYDADLLDDGDAYLAMRFLEGAPLDGVLAAARRGEPSGQLSLPPRQPGEIVEVVSVVERLAEALQVVHDAGIVHRDVKPGNVVLTPDRGPVLLDFGIARADTGFLDLTQPGAISGTPPYMAPEQVQGATMDGRVDVWALGVMLYELLALKRPFEGKSQADLFDRIVHHEPPRLRRVAPAVPPDLAAIVATAMEKDPSRRYRTARLFAEDLAAFRSGRTVRARPVSTLVRAGRWVKREPVKAGLAAAVLAALLVGSVLVANWSRIREARQAERERQTESLLEQGILAFVTGDRSPLPALRQAAELAPDSPEVICALALVHLDAGDRKAALAEIARWDGPAPPTLSLLEHYVRTGVIDDDDAAIPDDARPAVYAFAKGLMIRSVRRKETPRVSERALRQFELATFFAPRPRALHHFMRAEAAAYAEDPKAAREASDVIRRAWPGRPAASYFAGLAELQFDPARAEDSFRRMLRSSPDSFIAWNNLGDALSRQDRDAEAADAFRRAIDLRPSEASFHFNLGTSLASLGGHADALPSFAEAERLAPQDARFPFQRGWSAANTGDLGLARTCYERTLELDPRHGQALRNLAELCQQTGDLGTSRDLVRRALEQTPEDPKLLPYLSQVLMRDERWAEAARTLEKALDRSTPHLRLRLIAARLAADELTPEEAIAATGPDASDSARRLLGYLRAMGATEAARRLHRHLRK